MASLVAIRTSHPLLALSISRYSYTFISYQAERNGKGALLALELRALGPGAIFRQVAERTHSDSLGRLP